MKLSVVCVTKNEAYALRFISKMCFQSQVLGGEFVLGLDNCENDLIFPKTAIIKIVPVHSKGYLESVLNEVISRCSGDWILRLDDDESMSEKLFDTLQHLDELKGDVFNLPRFNLWQDENHYIVNDPLFPDVQTRLAIREKSNWQDIIHCGGLYGGQVIDAPIYHHKFLVKTRNERMAIAKRYEQIKSGAGYGPYKVFSLPEDCLEYIHLGEIERETHENPVA
jgi:hypothetical protein